MERHKWFEETHICVLEKGRLSPPKTGTYLVYFNCNNYNGMI